MTSDVDAPRPDRSGRIADDERDALIEGSTASGRSKRSRARALLLGALLLAAFLVGTAAGGLAVWKKLDDDTPPVTVETVFGVRELPDGAYSFVVSNETISVYDIERGHALVKKVAIPDRYTMTGVRGVAADAASRRLYVSFWGDSYGEGVGYVLAYDLLVDRVVWKRSYRPSIDSMAVSRDGRKLYMPCGEEQGECDHWFVLDAWTGDEIGRIPMHDGAHNTIVSLDGRWAYLASLKHDRLAVVDTSTDRIIRWVGPFGDSIRPFTVTSDGSAAFVTVDFLSGFEVGDLRTGRKLYRVPVRGFPLRPEDYPELPVTQSHGIALTPDETEVWVVDSFHRYLHVFDVTGLPEQKPRQIADIPLTDDPKWINFTRDGRYAHVSTGEIVDVRTRKVVALTEQSRQFLQIDWRAGRPVRAYSRYGLGYATEGG